MKSRIIRDIRYYEEKPKDYSGTYDGSFGNVYKGTLDTVFIGKRIARKLNELELVSGSFDHLYIYLSTEMKAGAVELSNQFSDDGIVSFKYGLNQECFNHLTESEKDEKITEVTFEVLRFANTKDSNKLKVIECSMELLRENGRDLLIHYKTKETKSYKVDVSYQIMSEDGYSKILVDYSDKRTNSQNNTWVRLHRHEDIYSLVKKITVKDNSVILHPGTSYYDSLVIKNYEVPISVSI